MTYPFYKIITYGNYKDLAVWKDHFKMIERPFAITRRRRFSGDDGYYYALWIVGRESISESNLVEGVANSEPLDGEVTEAWGGFEKYLEVENALSQL